MGTSQAMRTELWMVRQQKTVLQALERCGDGLVCMLAGWRSVALVAAHSSTLATPARSGARRQPCAGQSTPMSTLAFRWRLAALTTPRSKGPICLHRVVLASTECSERGLLTRTNPTGTKLRRTGRTANKTGVFRFCFGFFFALPLKAVVV